MVYSLLWVMQDLYHQPDGYVEPQEFMFGLGALYVRRWLGVSVRDDTSCNCNFRTHNM